MKVNKISSDLRDRFIDGDKLSVKDIVDDYFTPKSPYSYLVAVKSVRQTLSGLKRAFHVKDGIWFGCLDNDGHYGVATTSEEVRYAMISYYKFIKGNMANASLLVNNARANGILPAGLTQERLLVAKIEEEKEDKK